MKIYRWYAAKICTSGLTVQSPEASNEDVTNEIYNYIVDTFYETKFVPNYTKEELELIVWAIDTDDNYNDKYPNTIVTGY
jgi:hypothetical protein